MKSLERAKEQILDGEDPEALKDATSAELELVCGATRWSPSRCRKKSHRRSFWMRGANKVVTNVAGENNKQTERNMREGSREKMSTEEE